MALIEPATDPSDIRRNLDKLGLPYDPVSFAPPRDPDDAPRSDSHRRVNRGPPPPDPPDRAAPRSAADSDDPPWQDDCQLPLDDDAAQLPPDAEI